VISVSHLDVVLAFVGATGSTLVSFIIPGMCFWKLNQGSNAEKWASIILFIYGVTVMIVCLTSNVLRLFQ